jgi:hypothetical protein
MPALVKSSVGSFAGTSELECTRRCCFVSKKRRKSSRIWLPVRNCMMPTVYQRFRVERCALQEKPNGGAYDAGEDSPMRRWLGVMIAVLLMPGLACAQSFNTLTAEERKDKDVKIEQRARQENLNVLKRLNDMSQNGAILKPEPPGYRAQAKIALDALIALRHAKQERAEEVAYYELNDTAYQALFEADVNLVNFFDAQTAMLMSHEYLGLTMEKTSRDRIPNLPDFRQSADVMYAACEEDMRHRLEGESSSLCMDAVKRYTEILNAYNEQRKKELDNPQPSTPAPR